MRGMVKNNRKNITTKVTLIIVLTLAALLGTKIYLSNAFNFKANNNGNINSDANLDIYGENNNHDNENVQDPEANDLFYDYYDKAEKLLSTMTLEEKVGQMFLVRFPTSGVIKEIQNHNPGGYILFARDFKNETKTSILKKLKDCQKASKINMILGVDEEGGTVTRVSRYTAFRSSKFLSPQQIYKKSGMDGILKDSTEKSTLLQSIGLNMNLAPVADVATKSTSFIYDRSYGKGAKETATYVAEVVKRMNKDNMISVIKHFPGYGDNVDTHTRIAKDNRKYSVFEESDFLPFIAGIKEGAPCILVNHNIVKSMDKNMPASLSKNVIDILRNELNFSGIIMTDDLSMDAVKSYVENKEAAVQAILAGNDVIISSDFVNQKNEVLNAVKKNKISEEVIDKAVRRILAMKFAYKIIE